MIERRLDGSSEPAFASLLRPILRQICRDRHLLGGEFDRRAPFQNRRGDVPCDKAEPNDAGEMGASSPAFLGEFGDRSAVAAQDETAETVGADERPHRTVVGRAGLAIAKDIDQMPRSISTRFGIVGTESRMVSPSAASGHSAAGLLVAHGDAVGSAADQPEHGVGTDGDVDGLRGHHDRPHQPMQDRDFLGRCEGRPSLGDFSCANDEPSPFVDVPRAVRRSRRSPKRRRGIR